MIQYRHVLLLLLLVLLDLSGQVLLIFTSQDMDITKQPESGLEGLRSTFLHTHIQQEAVFQSTNNRTKDDDKEDWKHQWLSHGLGGSNDTEARILLVHVGKTAGTGLRLTAHMALARKRDEALPCVMNLTTTTANTMTTLSHAWSQCYTPIDNATAASALGQHVWGHKHTYSSWYEPEVLEWFVGNAANTFLFTLRSPVARIVSAFNFHHHKAVQNKQRLRDYERHQTPHVDMEFFFGCGFTTITHVAERLQFIDNAQMRGNRTYRRCTQLAQKILQGRGPSGLEGTGDRLQHFYYNYDSYVRETMDARPHVPIVVVRSKHLREDSQRLNEALGGTVPYQKDVVHTHGSEHFAVNSGIATAAGRHAICCQIHRDLAQYQRIVLAALNLDRTQKQQTLQEAFEECNVRDYNLEQVMDQSFSWSTWQKQNC